MTDSPAPVADHVAETVSELAELHAAHQDTAGGLERAIRKATNRVGRPQFLALLLLAGGIWIAGNVFADRSGSAIDPAPFVYLELFGTYVGVALTILILVTQQRDDALAERREQLTLELAVISDRKSAKIIALLQELREDLPTVSNRTDAEASEMATPDNPAEILDAIRTSHGKTQSEVDEPDLNE
jgi:uncharacterized membrane protein